MAELKIVEFFLYIKNYFNFMWNFMKKTGEGHFWFGNKTFQSYFLFLYLF